MANVKFLTGTETNLLKKNSDDSYVNPIREGSLYVTAERVSGTWISNLYYDTATERIKVSDTSGKAMYDHMNHNIAETYIMQITTEGSKYASTDGATLTYTKGSGAPTTILLPLASETTAGVVNTGAQTFAGNKTFKGRVILQGGNDTAAGTANTGALIVGVPTGAHISIDANEIQGKANGTSATQLHINNDGGATQFGGNVQPKTDNALTLGTESLRWKNIYGVTIKATTFNGALVGNVTGALIGNAATADKWYTARTLSLGSDLQGSVSIDGSQNVTLNASHYNVSCGSNNKSNYPWHRIATTGVVTGTHNDKDMTIVIRHTYKDGGYGLAKVSLRTDASGTASSAGVRWLYRYNIDKENLQIGLRNISGNTLADLYYKVGTWARCKIYQVEGNRTWTLISSNEVSDTTTSDKKTSTECYLSVADGGTKLSAGYTNTIKAVDGGIVERANNATLADKATSDTANHAILTHYISNIDFDGTTNKATKVVSNLYDGSGKVKATIDFPSASSTQAGAITTGSQTLTGAKIIDVNGSLEIKGSSKFNFSGIGSATSGSADDNNYIRNIWFSHATQKGTPVYNDGFKFDPKAAKVWDELTSEVSDKVVYTLETLKTNTRKNFNRVIADIFQGIAVKAYADIGSRPFATHYLSDISYLDKKADTDNVSKVVTVLYSGSGAEKKKVDFPTASSSTAGVVTIDSQTFAGNKTFTGRVYIKNSSDAGLTTADSGALVIGDKAGEHIIIDSNEIMGKSNGTTSRELLFQWDGGNVGFGGMVLPKTDKTSSVGSSSRRWGTVYADTVNASKELKTATGTFYADSAGNGYFGNSVGIRVAPDDNYALKITGDTLLNGNLYFANGNTYYVNSSGEIKIKGVIGDLIMLTPSSSIYWDGGSYRQRIATVDDSTANTDVFKFQQTSDSAASWRDLLRIQDDGALILTNNTGRINKYYSAASTIPAIAISANNVDINAIRIAHSTDGLSYSTGYTIKYKGAGDGLNNLLEIWADGTGMTTPKENVAISINQAGQIGLGTTASSSYRLYVNGVTSIVGGVEATTAGNNGTLRVTGGSSISAASWFGSNLTIGGWTNSAGGFGVNSTAGDGRGLSLYNGTDGKKPTYGIFFAKTATFGKIGGITSDWATYFSMSDTAGRGWQFMRGSLNVMAIDTTGSIYSYFGPPTGYTATDVFHKVGTAKRTIGLCAAVSGNSGIYDYTKSKWMIYARENVDAGLITDKKLALGEDLYAYNILPFYSESHTTKGGDNQYDLGSSGNKWRNLYIGTSVVSSLTTSTHLAGNQGKAIIYSTAAGNGYNMLARMKSTNGVWTFGSYGTNFNFYYTADSTISANSNSVTKTLTLLNESGNSTFPGQITATKFVGPLQGNATTATTLATARKINGTSFNGSGDITTSFWGTTRVFTISDNGNANTGPQVNVNGSGNVNILLPATINANVVGNITGNVSGTSGRPAGFASSSSNATWGNQTGTTVVCWNDDAGGSVDWRKNNPSSGKLSIKVDGRVYVNEGNTPVATLTNANSFWGMGDPDGKTDVWIRTTTQGIIPYQSGNVGSGHQSLGTSSWYFSASYIDKMWTKNVHIKETNATEGVELKYNATNDYLEFVFIS